MQPHDSPLLLGLNPEQQQAVAIDDGPVLVVAGPGSGKTRVLAHRIAWLISEMQVPPTGILAVTFTNKAAREMRDRVDNLLGPEASAGLTMGTFHSFGVRLLRENPGFVADRLGVLPNFSIYDDADQIAIAKQAVIAQGLDPKTVAPRRMLSRISAAKSTLLSPTDVADEARTYDDEIVSRVYREYQRLLSTANAVDFDDLLGLPLRLFDAEPLLLDRYQDRFRHVLVDEYQDTNRVQYILVSALSERHRNLFVVGDPDQSIYRWRQADIRNILDFETDFPDARRVDLEINYRSTARIVAVADHVIRENRERIDRALRTDNDDGDQILIRELADQQHEAQFIVSEIRRQMASDNLVGSDFAVMYRTTAQSRVLEESFRTSDVPYQIVGGVRFYERKEVKDILAVLRLINNPRDSVSLERVLENMPLGRGFGPKALGTLKEWTDLTRLSLLDGLMATMPDRDFGHAPQFSGAAKSAATRIGNFFAAVQQTAQEEKLVVLFDEVVGASGYKASFNNQDEDDLERWANVLEVRADMEKYDSMKPGDALTAYLEQVALVADVDSLDTDQRSRVTLITLHSAKGLEFPVVFIAGLEEGLLPVSRAVENEFEDPAGIEEERRLFYVGITRAQKRLFLTHVSSRMTWGRIAPGVQSRFVESLPNDHVRDLGRRQFTQGSAGNGALAERVRTAMPAYGSGRSVSASAAQVRPTVVYAQNDKVFHSKFGEGVIVEVVDHRGDQEVAIEFQRHGRKRLLASLAPLEVISE